ncbi:murein biosynthesis integral membrane protein MurJ [Terribacillus goriensis]|uniref:murein biosynthesis integral membrane protein MurJ n=1 Tax=Terribacillus saccharophilus TaxID=361277 RepID=UPI003982E7FC
MKKKAGAKILLFMLLLALAQKFLGFFREMLLAQQFGTSIETDAYIIGLTIPTVVFAAVLAAITTTYIPIYIKIQNQKGEVQANTFTNNLLLIVLLISLVAMIFCQIFAPFIVGIVGSGLSAEGNSIAVNLTRVSLLMLPLLTLIAMYKVYLEARSKYLMPAFINIPIIVIVIISLMFADKIGVLGVMIANILGAIIQVLIMAIYARKEGYHVRFKKINFKDKNLIEMSLLVIPVLIGTSVQQVNIAVDRILGSRLGEGSIAALSFGQKINEVFFGLISSTISTFIFPKLSNLNSSNLENQFEELVRRSLNLVSLVVLPITMIVIFYNEFIVRILFERGAFNEESTLLTSSALLFYSIGMLFLGFRDVLNRTFYSMGNTKTPMRNAAIATVSNIFLSIVLMNVIGFVGIPLASSISSIITSTLLLISLRATISKFNFSSFIIVQIKILLSSLILIIVSKYCIGLLAPSESLEALFVAVGILIGFLVYGLSLFFLRVKEVRMLVGGVLEKIKGRKEKRNE